jgi:hypothetical protein
MEIHVGEAVEIGNIVGKVRLPFFPSVLILFVMELQFFLDALALIGKWFILVGLDVAQLLVVEDFVVEFAFPDAVEVQRLLEEIDIAEPDCAPLPRLPVLHVDRLFFLLYELN